jgi:hypothetical protein
MVVARDSTESYVQGQIKIEEFVWYHLAYVFSDKSELAIYVNGKMSGKIIDSVYPATNEILQINYFGITRDDEYLGNFQLDDVKLYSVALNQVHIQMDMKTRSGIATGICDSFSSKKLNRLKL